MNVNASEVNSLLTKSGKVCAIFSGHYHPGLDMHIGKIPYVALAALCDGDAASCAVVEIADGKVTVNGYGKQKTIEF